ncbi:hypothetical protein E2C01_090817 [Portunus trituberculatus]|uniref:Uncharacterized protein n=2 Tax=Portunus trituberculatus TaxID=210409 RepID=A0A5B7JLC6_PORTR|nr:hypothetical protein [Portunus trituberculatus]
MTCAWRDEALPCELSPDLYFMNYNFGRKVPTDDGNGERYAHVNEQVPATTGR